MERSKKWLTAEEAMALLASDGEYQVKLAKQAAEQEAERKKIALAEEPLVEKLRGAGLPIETFNLYPFRPVEPNIIDIVLDFLPQAAEATVATIALQLKLAKKKPFDGRPLAVAFERLEFSRSTRGQIAYAIAETCPSGVEDWLERAFEDETLGDLRVILGLALARCHPGNHTRELLRKNVTQDPSIIAEALAICGDSSDLEHMRQLLPTFDAKIQREVVKHLKKLEKRLERHSGK